MKHQGKRSRRDYYRDVSSFKFYSYNPLALTSVELVLTLFQGSLIDPNNAMLLPYAAIVLFIRPTCLNVSGAGVDALPGLSDGCKEAIWRVKTSVLQSTVFISFHFNFSFSMHANRMQMRNEGLRFERVE